MIRKNNNILIRISSVFLILFLGVTILGFSKNKKSKLDLESKEFYKYARYLFTKNERKIFRRLPNNDARARFIKYFWEIRDPNPYTPENEFKIEMEDRFEYVTRHLKEGPVPGWKSDRGRIYILLGPPDSKYEEFSQRDRDTKPFIIWYYNSSDILIYFVSTKGFGSFQMDLRRTSLSLIDELEKRKYYIANKDDSGFETSELKFKLKYDPKTGTLIYNVDTSKVLFKKENSNMMAKFKIDYIIYSKGSNIDKKTEIKTVYMDKETLLKKKSSIEIALPVDLPKGKIAIDSIISDFLGNAVGRKYLTLKVK